MTWLREHGPALLVFTATTVVFTYPLSLSPARLTVDDGVDQ